MAVDRRPFGKARRSDDAGAAGGNHAGYFAVDDPFAATTGEPVDMAQVRADDALIDALAGRNRAAGDPLDERVASLLLAWRDDVNAEAAGPLVDMETATSTVKSAPRPRSRRTFGPLAAAAAVLVIAFTGVGLAARDAEPGNPLWGVTKVLYSEKAKSVEAAVAVRNKLEAASQALESGRVDDAQVALEQAQQKLPVVADEDGQDDLVARTEQLIAQLEDLTPIPPTSPTGTETAITSTTPDVTTEPVESTTELPVTETTEPPVTTQPSPGTTEESTSRQANESSPGGEPGSNEPGNSDPDQTPDESGVAGTSTTGSMTA